MDLTLTKLFVRFTDAVKITDIQTYKHTDAKHKFELQRKLPRGKVILRRKKKTLKGA